MNCKICFEKFDRLAKKPMNISCGHSFCYDCLIQLKARNSYMCPMCRDPIKNEQPNYAVLDLLDLNLIVDPYLTLRHDISKTYKEIEEANFDLKLKLKKIIQDQVDTIKSTINDRAAELVDKIMARHETLILEAENIHNNLNEKVESIFVVNRVNFEQMSKQELDNLKTKLSREKKVYFPNQNELNGIENLIEFKLDEINEYEIGKFENSDFFNICDCVIINNSTPQKIKSDQQIKVIECLNEKIIKSNQNHAIDYNKKGKQLHSMGKYLEALDYYDKAIQLNPNVYNVYANKGGCLNNLGRYDEAIQCYDRAIHLNPNDALSLNGKGNSLDKMGKHLEAIQFYNKAIQLTPNADSVYHINKGVSLSCLGKCKEAIDCFNKAIQLNPRAFNAFVAKGTSLLVMGKYQEAIDCFNKAIELKPNDVNTLNLIGISLDEIGKNEEAIVCHNRAIQLNPQINDLYRYRQIALKKLKK